MARADTYTIVPLDTYARIMGLNPLHFNGGRITGIAPEPFTTYGNNIHADGQGLVDGRPIWQQFEWQDPAGFSRDELSRIIAQAEFDVAEFLGYQIAPTWIIDEYHQYPQYFRRDIYGDGIDSHGQAKIIRLRNGKILSQGIRTADLIASPSVAAGDMVFTDEDLDGFYETATLTVATTVTNPCQLKAYFAGHDAAPAWEIRPARSVTITGGVATMVFDKWLFFDPDLVNAIPQGVVTGIVADDGDSYVQSCEVYWEYTDLTQSSVTFYWERKQTGSLPTAVCCDSCGGTGCEVCNLDTQAGCFSVRDWEAGTIAPVPSTYDEDNAMWLRSTWTECREPDSLKVSYYSGNLPKNQYTGGACNYLDMNLARAVALIATARIPCGTSRSSVQNIADKVDYYSRNEAESGSSLNTIFTPPEMLSNPFGTRRGEIMAYKSLSNMRKRVMRVGVTVA